MTVCNELKYSLLHEVKTMSYSRKNDQSDQKKGNGS